MRLKILRASAIILALALIMTVCFIIAGQLSGLASVSNAPAAAPLKTAEPQASQNPGRILAILLLNSVLISAVFTFLIIRSRWHSWKLIIAVFLAFYGSMTVISQIESLVYLQNRLPEGMVAKLFIMGVMVAGMFAPLAVLILGKIKQKPDSSIIENGPGWSTRQWLARLAIGVFVYLVLYYTCGYFIAWKEPAVRAYYDGSDPGNFLAQLLSIWQNTPWMIPLQAFRALLWLGLTLPLIRTLAGPRWQVCLLAATLFAVWSFQLLLPNEFMPPAVTKIHLIETLISNLIFGAFVGTLFFRSEYTKFSIVR